MAGLRKQLPHLLSLIDNHMQIHARRQQTCVSSRGLDLCERPPVGERMANESVPPVVDRQRSEPIPAQDAARCVEPAAEDVVIEGLAESRRLQ